MSDIVDRLRDPINQDIPFTKLMLDAAARIEQLEVALREIVDYCDNTGKWEPITMTRIIERVDDCARAALEGKP